MRIVWATFILAALLAPPACGADDHRIARAIAPSGTLRAAINLGNPVLAHRGADGAVSGVSVDLARALSDRIGVPLSLVPYDSAGAVSGAVESGAWDICFLAVDPKRAEGITFTAPYVVIEGSYLVPAASPIRSMEDVDRAGIRIAVGRGSAYDLHLTRAIRHATLERAATSPAAIALFAESGLGGRGQRASAARSLCGRASRDADAAGAFHGDRAGDGRAERIGSRAAAYLRRFVEAMKAERVRGEILEARTVRRRRWRPPSETPPLLPEHGSQVRRVPSPEPRSRPIPRESPYSAATRGGGG